MSAIVTGVSDTIATGALPLAVAVAALAGLVSFASPCVLPLVPGFLGYVTGLSDAARQSRWRVVLGALLFVAGFSTVFILGSIFITSAGVALVEHRVLLMRAGGVLVIALALVFLGVGGARTQRELTISWRPRGRAARRPGARRGVRARLGAVHRPDPGGGAHHRGELGGPQRDPGRGPGHGILPRPRAPVPPRRGWPRRRQPAPPAWLRGHLRGSAASSAAPCCSLVGVLLVTGWWESLNRWVQTELVTGFQVVI